jgi:hypothetical protein
MDAGRTSIALAEQGRLVEAIARTDDVGVLTQALKDREGRRAHLQQELAALGAREQLKSFDSSAVARALRRRIDEWRGLVRRNTPIARQVLNRLLTDRICVDATARRGRLRRGRCRCLPALHDESRIFGSADEDGRRQRVRACTGGEGSSSHYAHNDK